MQNIIANPKPNQVLEILKDKKLDPILDLVSKNKELQNKSPLIKGLDEEKIVEAISKASTKNLIDLLEKMVQFFNTIR